MQQKMDVVIVGGGIIGCAIAYFLCKAGLSVRVLERHEVGSQASSAAAGLLAPLGPLSGPGPFADLLLTGWSRLIAMVPELEDATGFPLMYEQCGALRVVRTTKRLPHLQKRLHAWKALGLTMQWLSGDEARQLEPSLSSDIVGAIYAPEESQISAIQTVQAFSLAARRAGAILSPYSEVVGLTTHNKSIVSVELASHETLSCQHVVFATGAWSSCYANWLHLDIPVAPQKGQMLLAQAPAVPLRHLIFGEAIYLADKEDGILIGATKEDAGFDLQTTDDGLSWLRQRATRLVPGIDFSRTIRSWAGLRPKTPDGQPILGRAPGWNNVSLAVGHNSTGIMLSAITGHVMTELICKNTLPEIIVPFALERFGTL